jgi:hypothetical protein
MVSLIPKDTSFFQMFSEMSDNLVTGARTLVELFANYRDVEKTIDTVQKIERHGDELTHNVLTKLNQTFITPFDREDIALPIPRRLRESCPRSSFYRARNCRKQSRFYKNKRTATC